MISLQKGVFKGARNFLWQYRVQDNLGREDHEALPGIVVEARLHINFISIIWQMLWLWVQWIGNRIWGKDIKSILHLTDVELSLDGEKNAMFGISIQWGSSDFWQHINFLKFCHWCWKYIKCN